jgi:hypothetical protein
MWMKVINKYIKFQSNTSKIIGHNWDGKKNLTKSKINVHIDIVKIYDRVMYSCLEEGKIAPNKNRA